MRILSVILMLSFAVPSALVARALDGSCCGGHTIASNEDAHADTKAHAETKARACCSARVAESTDESERSHPGSEDTKCHCIKICCVSVSFFSEAPTLCSILTEQSNIYVEAADAAADGFTSKLRRPPRALA